MYLVTYLLCSQVPNLISLNFKPSRLFEAHRAPTEATEALIYFSFDIETTESCKRYDWIIDLGMIASNHRGVELACFSSRYGNAGVQITDGAYKCHGISVQQLRGTSGRAGGGGAAAVDQVRQRPAVDQA